MTRYLVRHTKAGKRSQWQGDDRLRPVTGSGRRQAEAIAAWLAPLAPVALLTSPYLRCRQSLEPLADTTGLPLTEEPALAEGEAPESALDLIAAAAPGTVLCSHGDVIDGIVELLERSGATLVDAPVTVRKGTTVVIEPRDDGPWRVSFVRCER